MLDYAVLGLGFNVVAPAEGWPAELQSVAGALFDGDRRRCRAALAAAFLNEFWPLYRTGRAAGIWTNTAAVWRWRVSAFWSRRAAAHRAPPPCWALMMNAGLSCAMTVKAALLP